MASYKRFKSTTTDYSIPAYLSALRLNIKVIMIFFKNNQYLLSKRGINLYAQIKSMRAKGLRIDYSNVKKYSQGVIEGISLTYLHFFCDYWGKSLVDMISYDLEEYENRMLESTAV